MNKNFKTCTAVILAFISGFILGIWAHAGRNDMLPSDIPMCDNNIAPDKNGCCPGEIYTDMYDLGFNCCPETGGDCFPPLR
ncbi:MAG: hypothetical protein IKW57_02920 [Alphaproteobacteria bacterium]|nr:hypothetical protein [Alphaproteobacteria bacterium]